MALTATATERVCEDLREILGIPGCEVFRRSINRPNLYYEMAAKPPSPDEQLRLLVGWIKRHFSAGESGIVYCLTQKDAEQMAGNLFANGIVADFYHANMEPEHREQVHMEWSSGGIQVLAATVAFGMGINKPDVRFVVHESMSKSLENYYQESGRAGRDGKPARCLLLYRFADIPRQAALVSLEPRWRDNLPQAMAFCCSAGPGACRRAVLAMHFNEAPPECHGMCDLCANRLPGGEGSRPQEKDATELGKSILRTLAAQQQAQKKCTLIQLIDRWRSNKQGGEAKLAKSISREEAERVVARLMLESYLEFEFGYTAYATTAYLVCSGTCSLLLSGKRKLMLPPEPEGNLEEAEQESPLLLALDRIRVRVAAEANTVVESVLPPAALRLLQQQQPSSMEQLATILSEHKASLIGAEVLEAIKRHSKPGGIGGQDQEWRKEVGGEEEKEEFMVSRAKPKRRRVATKKK